MHLFIRRIESERYVKTCGPSPGKKVYVIFGAIALLELPVDLDLKECSCALKALRYDIEPDCSLEIGSICG